jgi:hypothetical protein
MEAIEVVKLGITISDWLMMLAVVLGPILAVQIQKFIERKSESKNNKLKVFQSLMTTRASTLAYQHVSALNMVGLEFNEKKYSKVVNAWKTYLDHLSSYPKDDLNMQKVWSEKRDDQLSDLLYEMGISLNFDFDKVHIKKAGYFPQAYVDQEMQNNFIRRELTEILLGNKSIPMSVVEFPTDNEALESQKDLHDLMKKYYENRISSLDKTEAENS